MSKGRTIIAKVGKAYNADPIWVGGECTQVKFISIFLKRAKRSKEYKGAYDGYGDWLEVRWQGNVGDNRERPWYGAHLNGRTSISRLDLPLLQKVVKMFRYDTQPREMLEMLGAIEVEHSAQGAYYIYYPAGVGV